MFSIIRISEVLKYMYLLFSCLTSEVSKVHCTECKRMNGTTGQEWLIRSHLSARFCFELSGNSN